MISIKQRVMFESSGKSFLILIERCSTLILSSSSWEMKHTVWRTFRCGHCPCSGQIKVNTVWMVCVWAVPICLEQYARVISDAQAIDGCFQWKKLPPVVDWMFGILRYSKWLIRDGCQCCNQKSFVKKGDKITRWKYVCFVRYSLWKFF